MPLLDSYLLDNYLIDGFDKDAPLTLLASGSAVASSSTSPVVRFDTQAAWASSYNVTVNQNFGTIPKMIIFKRSGLTENIFLRDVKNSLGNSLVTIGNGSTAVTTPDWYVNNSQFRLPVNTQGQTDRKSVV